jgi:ribose/xylose/arabinose/galactoside ABC-type transport system permease subunit
MAAIGGIIFAAQVKSVALTYPPGNLLLNAIRYAVNGGGSVNVSSPSSSRAA